MKVIKKILCEYILILLIITIAFTLFKVFGCNLKYLSYTNNFSVNSTISLVSGIFDRFKQSLIISGIIEILLLLVRILLKVIVMMVKSLKENV